MSLLVGIREAFSTCAKLCTSKVHNKAIKLLQLLQLFNISSLTCCAGFASRLPKDFYSPKIFDSLDHFDTIVWDGDDLSEGSFTKIIAHNAFQRRNVSLVSFKYESEVQRFHESWHNKQVSFEEAVDKCVMVLRKPEQGCSTLFEQNIHLFAVPDSVSLDSNHPINHYADLGCHILDCTKSNDVICFGGAGCCAEEFRRSISSTTWGSYLSRGVTQWHFFPTSRFKRANMDNKSDTQTQCEMEDCFFAPGGSASVRQDLIPLVTKATPSP